MSSFFNCKRILIGTFFIVLLFLPSSLFAASVTLAWDRPGGSAVSGYNIYYGQQGTDYKNSPRKVINSANQTQLVIEGLEPGAQYVFTATSHDGNGRESDFARAMSYTVPITTYSVTAAVKPNEAGTIRSTSANMVSIESGNVTSLSIFECRDNCSVKLKADSSATFSIEPDQGRIITDVTVNGSSVGAISSYTIKNISGNQTITAYFGLSNDASPPSSGSQPENPPDTQTPQTPQPVPGSNSNTQSDTQSPTSTTSSKSNTETKTQPPQSTTGTETGKLTEEKPAQKTQQPIPLKPVGYTEAAPGNAIRLKTDVDRLPKETALYVSHWQIRYITEKKPFYDVTSDIELTTHDVSAPLSNGMKYAWRIGFQNSESGSMTWSDEQHFILGKKALQEQTPPVSPGTLRNDYQMVSLTHWPADASSNTVFGPMMGNSYSSENYRILAYDPNSNWKPGPQWQGGYRNYGDFEVVPGRAYWVLAKHGLDLTMEGVPVATDADILVNLDYNIATEDGWTMIAVPNNAAYYWGDVEIIVHDENGDVFYGPMPIRQLSENNPYIDTRLWEWEKGINPRYEVQVSNSFLLTPYGGFWVRARAENVSLSFPYDMQAALDNPDVMMDNPLKAEPNVAKETLLSGSADEPPMPMAGLEESLADYRQEATGSNSGGSDSMGCFVGSLSRQSK